MARDLRVRAVRRSASNWPTSPQAFIHLALIMATVALDEALDCAEA
ncbi:hypothetical protein J7E88_10720 [Streptomyces sp. ISL-10]|nr:hypothetical protein [Streptomyces sp. ISL-10]MBT2365772.1 hypothetical protein [Streptomyces sp. ISL-10]